jgi:hypothetical protein
MRLYACLFVAVMLLVGRNAVADEGMWLPSFLNKLNVSEMQDKGASLTAEDIYSINHSSLKDAVIALDHGSCTGELVSAEGLFLTNHHCGYGEIQKHSSEGNNILRDGFWAKSKADELPNPGKTVTFLIRVEDVSEKVNAILTADMKEDVRKDSIQAISARLEKEAEGDTHYDVDVKSFYNSNRFYLFVTETFKDVRLVATPPHFIGKFGGDTDNWMWPRHTGDFSIFRIYTGPDGKPAEYAAENVPLKPRHFFPISLKGYNNNDFAMVMGYPGSTDRYLTSGGVEYTMKLVNDTRIKVRKEKLAIIANYMVTSEKATIQYASKYARSSNYYKYSIGQNKGLTKLKVIDKKRGIEEDFTNWVNQSDERKAKYGNALTLINEAYANITDDVASKFIDEALVRGPEIFFFANYFEGLNTTLRTSTDENFIEESVERVKARMEGYFKDYDADTDCKLVAALTKIYAEQVDPMYHPAFIAEIQKKYKGDYQAWAEKLFAKSMFDEEAKVNAFLKKPTYAALANDPVFKIKTQIFAMRSKINDDNSSDLEDLAVGYRLYTAGLMEMYPDKAFYPNANSTMRVTYGQVGDYSPGDAIQYNYYTTLKGYIEKEIPGDREFDVWPRLKELYAAKDFGRYATPDGQLNTCFITNNDITGGNSGSPVLNGKGELIGIAFDGNWEAMSGDIAFETELQKCINVDIRFVLWTIDKFAGATNLIDELTIHE